MPLIRILAEREEDETLPPPPPILHGGVFPIEDLLLDQVHGRERRRVREALALSVLANLFVLLMLLFGTRWMPPLTVRLEPVKPEQQPQLTYLEMPPDLITKAKPLHPKALSDRDRHFQHDDKITRSLSAPSTRPALKPQPAAPPPGPLAPAARPAPPRPTTLASGPPQPKPAPSNAAKDAGKPSPETGQLELQNVPQPSTHPGLKFNLNPANSMQRAIEGAVRDGARAHQQVTETAPLPRGGGGNAPGQTGAGVQILTDTQGVDFSSYLQRVIEIVRRNWYAVMPETVYLGTKGRVVIIFNINANGTVPGLNPVSLSGTPSLDHAAEASIHASNPFPPLPSAFHGPFIKLQFSFYYNLTPPGQ